MSETAPTAASDAGGPAAHTSTRRTAGKPSDRRSLFARIALFWRQVVAELKKVVRPTRNELVTYTSVVLVFVVIIMAFVTVVDLGISKVTFWVFG